MGWIVGLVVWFSRFVGLGGLFSWLVGLVGWIVVWFGWLVGLVGYLDSCMV